MSSAINIGLSNFTRLPKKLNSASLSFCSSAYSSSVSSSCSLACFRQTRSSALFTMTTPISEKVNSSSAVGAPKSDQEASSTGVVGANDFLIVGPGVLGRIVAEKWREEHPGSQIYGQTLTTNHHDELVKMGISPSLKGTQLNNKLPYVIFCAPPYPNLDYPGEVRAAPTPSSASNYSPHQSAYAAEDVIETHIFNRIHARSTSYDEEDMIGSSWHFCCCFLSKKWPIDLHKVTRDVGFVEKKVLEIKNTLGTRDPQTFIITDVVASKSTSTEHNIMVGFDDVLNEMLDKLTGQPDSGCQIIPISGMGGIGKTTLARNAYINPLTEYYFDVRAWVTISQQYNVRDILLGVLGEKNQGSGESMSEAEVGERLYKSLCGRRYLIVMDDMWSYEAWDKLKRFFPNECNGSRIIVTTRLTNVVSYLTTNNCGVEMDFLDEDKSWSLFCKTVFEEEDGCPSELEHVGTKISRNCKGLPLSIVVLGGLAKSKRTHEYWEYMAENLNSIVNLEENERCLKILRTSYDHLPAHLKACFLYMGVFPEDHKIHKSELIRMWVAESFLKPVNGKGFEESAEECFMDLVGRNLIMVHEDEFSWGKKVFKIHDLLRDLCIREGRKENFICVANQHSEGLNTQRRVAIHQDTSGKECLDSLNGGSTTRSLICYSGDVVLPLTKLRLLRVFTRFDSMGNKDIGNYTLTYILKQVNLRYLSLQCHIPEEIVFPSFVSQLWNVQTLNFSVYGGGVVAPPEIWKMPMIRHIKTNNLILPDPPDRRNDFVLHELHTLQKVSNLNLSAEVIKRIPNVKKLGLTYNLEYEKSVDLKNLDRLCKLEELYISIFCPPMQTQLKYNLTFPHSLKQLILWGTKLDLEDISTKIGSLPRLQMLILSYDSFKEQELKTVEGQFCSLKHLKIEDCNDLKRWITESTHFPCLECLRLSWLRNLEEIPLCIGDIS